MSKVKIQGNASGTGVLTVTAPNTSTDRTITLPDTTGTLLDENSSLPAANLTGTVADARFPATLPAASAANLTAIPAANITGALPAISGASLTAIPAANLTGSLPSGMGGKILQVVTGELTSHVQMATTSWQNTGLTANITPSAASSKILITVSFGKAQTTQNNGDHTYSMRLLRQVGGTNYDSDLNGVADGSRARALFSQGGHSYNASHSMGGFSITGVDSPNTTSEITYYAQAYPQSSSYPLILNGVSNNTNDANTYHSRTKAIITMMEIAG